MNVRLNLSRSFSRSVYLYGEAARSESRRSLPSIRAGEYEALLEKVRLQSVNLDMRLSVM